MIDVPGPGGGDGPAAARLRLVTFNIRNGRAIGDGCNHWWLRRRATAAAIAGLAPDVVGLQEVYRFQLRSLLHRLPALVATGRGRGRRGGGEHVPVLWRRGRLVLDGSETRWFGRPPGPFGTGGSRIVTLARLHDRGSGRPVGVANTHLDHRSADVRARSVDLLLRWLAEEPDRPWIVLGDLNETRDEPALRALLAAGYADPLAHLPATGPGAATAHGFTGSHDGKRIDHVLVPPPLVVLDARIVHDRPGGRLPSDHWPVVTDVELPAERR